MRRVSSKNKRREVKRKKRISFAQENFFWVFCNFFKRNLKIFTVFIVFICMILLFVLIKTKSEEELVLKYLKDKYNQEFTIRKNPHAANWIGKSPTYNGLAKAKNGNGIEFGVVCGLHSGKCIDSYLEKSWERGEEKRLRVALGSDLPQSVRVRVGITPKDERYDSNTSVDDFDYYLNKYSDDFLKKYFVTFVDHNNFTTIEDAKKIITKTINYIREKGITVKDKIDHMIKMEYRINIDDKYYNSCEYDIKEDLNYLNNCFKKERKVIIFK